MYDPNTIDFDKLTKENWKVLTGTIGEDDFETAFGLYIFATDYHSGQSSLGYRILNVLDCHYVGRQDQVIRGEVEDTKDDWYVARDVYLQMSASKWARQF